MPSKKVRQILRFITPKNTILPPIVIQSALGQWVIDGTYYANDREMYLKVAKCTAFPFRMEITQKERDKGYLDGFYLRNKEEALVYIAAHELRHCFQAQHPTAKRMGKRKNKYSESDADIYAVRKLEEWRKKKNRLKGN